MDNPVDMSVHNPVDVGGQHGGPSGGPSGGQPGGTAGKRRSNRYFHCVETPNPAAMKPKPTTMFQLPSASIGREPSVT